MTEDKIRIIVQGLSIISAFAAIVAGVLMRRLTKKFGTGILAAGFKSIAAGVLFIAIGILSDSVQDIYFNNYTSSDQATAFVSAAFFVVKALFFVIGTYVILIGSKKTADRLESLTK